MRRVLLAVLVTAATTMMMASPAHAGGPTSVLLTSPGTARAAALYYTDPRYAELEALLHGPEAERERDDDQLPRYSRGHHAQRHLAGPRREHLADRPAGPRRRRRTMGGDVDDPGRGRGRRPGGRRADLAGPGQRGPDQEAGLLARLARPGPGRRRGKPSKRPPVRACATVVGADDAGSADPADDARRRSHERETRWFSLTGWRWASTLVFFSVSSPGSLCAGRVVPAPDRARSSSMSSASGLLRLADARHVEVGDPQRGRRGAGEVRRPTRG